MQLYLPLLNRCRARGESSVPLYLALASRLVHIANIRHLYIEFHRVNTSGQPKCKTHKYIFKAPICTAKLRYQKATAKPFGIQLRKAKLTTKFLQPKSIYTYHVTTFVVKMSTSKLFVSLSM